MVTKSCLDDIETDASFDINSYLDTSHLPMAKGDDGCMSLDPVNPCCLSAFWIPKTLARKPLAYQNHEAVTEQNGWSCDIATEKG